MSAAGGIQCRKESDFVTGTWVSYQTPDGRRLCGQVVGPDQNYFPSPAEVFVLFPSRGFMRLLSVAELELAVPGSEGKEVGCG